MDIIGWLVLSEVIISLVLVIWYIVHLRHHVKRSPAEESLKKHLAELEAAKISSKKTTESNKADLSKSKKAESLDIHDNKEPVTINSIDTISEKDVT